MQHLHTDRKVERAQPLHSVFRPLRRHLVEDLGVARPVEAEDEPGDGLDGQGGPDRRHHAKIRGPGEQNADFIAISSSSYSALLQGFVDLTLRVAFYKKRDLTLDLKLKSTKTCTGTELSSCKNVSRRFPFPAKIYLEAVVSYIDATKSFTP